MPSSVIRRFDYRSDNASLEITFVSGRRYRYLDVPPDLHQRMRESFSKGEFFNQHIRDHFAFEKVGELN
jgi:lysyl-tRNA synthetase class 2